VSGIERVDVALETLDLAGRDRRLGPGRRGRSGELGLGDEEFVREPTDDVTDVRAALREHRGDEPEPGAELVVRAVGADPKRVLRYPRTAGKTGRSMVARTGIETRDALASGRPGSSSNGELNPWTGQNEM
jgi:hypothetical protein